MDKSTDITTTQLPAWDELSDLDKGAALLHLRAREDEGGSYAVEHYPAQYFDHPALKALDGKAASRHAQRILNGRDPFDVVGADEYFRLYDAALAAHRNRKA